VEANKVLWPASDLSMAKDLILLDPEPGERLLGPPQKSRWGPLISASI